MTRSQTAVLAIAVFASGFLLSMFAADQLPRSSWESAPGQDHWSAGPPMAKAPPATVAEPAQRRAAASSEFAVRLPVPVDRAETLAGDGNHPKLPPSCVSGLAGLDLAGNRSADVQAQVQTVRQLISANALRATPPPADGFPPKVSRSLPDPQPTDNGPANREAATIATQEFAGNPAKATWLVSGASGDGGDTGFSLADFENYNPHARATAAGADISHHRQPPADGLPTDPHADVFQETLFPSATRCAACHQQIFDEWAGSSHAYAAISPMFQKFEQKINDLTAGTIGYFCLRCHAPVATTVGLRRDQPIWDGPRVFREGVTCIACHRVRENYTKANGERRIEPGDVYDPVYSGGGGAGSQIAAKYADYFKVRTGPGDSRPGQPIHRRAIRFEQLSQSDYCMSCHQVAVQPGIKLEVVWDQYRASPAWREGIQCQDCHMGLVPGRAEGYSIGPAAVVDGKVIHPERKHSNHTFYGPGYSIAHPGVFPHNVKADRWTFNDWLLFDWRAGWGTEAFEQAVATGGFPADFPPPWQTADDRYDGREIIEQNLARLRYKKDLRRQVLENGSGLEGPFFQRDPVAGSALRFHYCVQNTNSGHNLPSGSLGAQPQLWLNVVLIGPSGQRVWETGYLDSVGDLADQHSRDVLERRVTLDKQLFNLQSKFLTTNVKGTDREMYLPINVDVDQLPFIRPVQQPVSVLNHPPLIRMEAHSIPPLGMRKAKFVIPAALLSEPGTWRLSARLRSRAEPIYFMEWVEATPEMIRMMNEWIVDAHMQSVVFEVSPPQEQSRH
jgi:hypothetical protein